MSFSSSSACLWRVSFYSRSSCFLSKTISFFNCSNFLLASSLSSIAYLAFDSLSISSIFFCVSSPLTTDNGESSISLLIATRRFSAPSHLALSSSICYYCFFLSYSSVVRSSLNLFFTLTTSSSFTVNWRLTSDILCFNSSSSYTIRSSLLCNSIALVRIFVSSCEILCMDSLNCLSLSPSFAFQVTVISSILSISLCFNHALNFCSSARFHISTCHTAWYSPPLFGLAFSYPALIYLAFWPTSPMSWR